jgi:hypothetical protein
VLVLLLAALGAFQSKSVLLFVYVYLALAMECLFILAWLLLWCCSEEELVPLTGSELVLGMYQHP